MDDRNNSVNSWNSSAKNVTFAPQEQNAEFSIMISECSINN